MQELRNVLETRQLIYKLLGGLYQIEVDAKKLEQLKNLRFPESSDNATMNQFGKGLNDAVDQLKVEDLDNLAADYARSLLGAGIADGQVAFPIESVYTSPEKLIMQDAYEAVLKQLQKHKIAPSKQDLYPDHIGIELEFMGFLSGKAIEAIDADKIEEVEALLDEQKTFLEKHLLNWTSKFFKDLSEVSSTDFYKNLCGFTQAFLEEDRQWLFE